MKDHETANGIAEMTNKFLRLSVLMKRNVRRG